MRSFTEEFVAAREGQILVCLGQLRILIRSAEAACPMITPAAR